MISDARAEAAVDFLRDTAKEYGTLRGHSAYADGNLKRVKSLQLIELTKGSLGEREAKAYASEEYRLALVEMKNATADSATLWAKRNAAEYTIEVWRTEQANSRRGNI